MKLVQSLCLPPDHCAVVPVQVDGDGELRGRLQLLEPDISFCESPQLEIPPTLLELSEHEDTELVVTNNSGFTQRIDAGVIIGQYVSAPIVEGPSFPITDPPLKSR